MFGTGMAALHAAFFALINPGDHAIVSSVVYMRVWGLFDSVLPAKLGIEVDFVDITDDRDVHIDKVDVLTADHPAPRVEETLPRPQDGQDRGGTQALRRAYTSDTRDRDRHLFDAAVLLAAHP